VNRCLPLALLALPLVGCPAPAAPPAEDPPAPPPLFLDVQAGVSDAVRTVVEVAWSTAEPTVGWVEFGLDETLGQRTPPSDPSALHDVDLLGLPSLTDVHYRLVAEVDGAPVASAVSIVRTGGVPATLPGVFVESGLRGSGYIIAPTLGQTTAELPGGPVVVLDQEGRYVWYDEMADGAESLRARASVDARGVLYFVTSRFDDGPPTGIQFVSWDGRERSFVETPDAHHDFVELPDGTLTVMTELLHDIGEGRLWGLDAIVEYRPDGTVVELWDSLDFALGPMALPPDPVGFGEGVTTVSWANAIDYDPVADAYYLSLHGPQTVVRIERGTGEMTWSLGDRGAAPLPGGEATFARTHGVDVTPDGVLVFANNSPQEDCSFLVEYEVGLEPAAATELWRHAHEPCRYAYALGNGERLDNGNTLAVWSTAGQIDEVTPDGELVFRVNTWLGAGFGYSIGVPSLYGEQEER